MGYIFENLIGRFYQNVDAGQFYTGRDIIKLLVSLFLAEGCDDIFDQGKVVTVCESKSAEYDTIQRLPYCLKIKGVQIHFRGCISEAEGAEL